MLFVLISSITPVFTKQCHPGEFECADDKMKICSDDGFWAITKCPLKTKCSKTKSSITCSLDSSIWDTKSIFGHREEEKEHIKPKISEKNIKNNEDKVGLDIVVDSIELNPKIQDTNEFKELKQQSGKSQKKSHRSESSEENEFMRLVSEREFLVDSLRKNKESLLLSTGIWKNNLLSQNLATTDIGTVPDEGAPETPVEDQMNGDGEEAVNLEIGDNNDNGEALNEGNQTICACKQRERPGMRAQSQQPRKGCNCRKQQQLQQQQTQQKEVVVEMQPVVKSIKPAKPLLPLPPLIQEKRQCPCKKQNGSYQQPETVFVGQPQLQPKQQNTCPCE